MHDDYPPAFDLGPRLLREYGILQIWLARDEPALRPALIALWQRQVDTFPTWVRDVVQGRRVRKRLYRNGGFTAPERDAFRLEWWDEDDSGEFEAWESPNFDLKSYPELARALYEGMDAVFKQARLSPGELEVIRLDPLGKQPTRTARLLGKQKQNVRTMHQRALAKLRRAFVLRDGLEKYRDFALHSRREAGRFQPAPGLSFAASLRKETALSAGRE